MSYLENRRRLHCEFELSARSHARDPFEGNFFGFQTSVKPMLDERTNDPILIRVFAVTLILGHRALGFLSLVKILIAITPRSKFTIILASI